MPLLGADRDAFVQRIKRRQHIAEKFYLAKRALRMTSATRQAAVYDATFRSDAEAISYSYALRNDHLPDLDNPVWLNEKIRWQFLHHRNPLMSLAADKIAVRDYLRYKNATITAPQLLTSGTTLEDLPYFRLPDKFVLKSSFGSGQMHIEDRIHPTPRDFLCQKIRKWQQRDRWRQTGELHYRPLAKRWLVEEYVPSRIRRREYQILCTMGEVVSVSIVLERDPLTGLVTRCALYDVDWHPISFNLRKAALETTPMARPPEMDQLLAEARRLSEDFLHVRVDFLQFDDRLVFSELTFANLAARISLDPIEANMRLGAMMDLDRAPDYLTKGYRIARALNWPMATHIYTPEPAPANALQLVGR